MSGTEILILTMGGVGLLLWGCRMVRTGVIRGFGGEIQRFVGRCAGNRASAGLAGAVVGTILQSSTAAALLISPFVGQGVILIAGALAIMLGADLGAAFAALIFASGISLTWPFMIIIGYGLHAGFANSNTRMKNIGRILIGFGLLFLGLQTISGAAVDMSASPTVLTMIEAAAGEPILAVLLGAALTWIAHSSIAMVLLAVALASGGGIAAPLLFPFVLGINLGAALPAITATLSEAPAARRVPLGNLLFRLAGVAISLPLLGYLPALMATPVLSPYLPEAGGQVVGLHLLFNGALVLVFLAFTGLMGRLVTLLLPDRPADAETSGPRYLDQSLLGTPPAALAAAARETLRMGGIVEEMLGGTLQAFETDEAALIQTIEATDDKVDELHEALKLYLTRLLQRELGKTDSQRAIDIVTYTTNLEHVGDIIDKNLMELAGKKQRRKLRFSEAGLAELRTMHAQAMATLHLSLNVFMSGDLDSARQLLAGKVEMRDLELAGTEKHLDRLRSGQLDSLGTSSIHLDVIRDIKRINSHLIAVAYPVLERAGELRQSRLKKKAEARLKNQRLSASLNPSAKS